MSLARAASPHAPLASVPADGSSLYIGVMSGTSLDGIDVALTEAGDSSIQLVASHFRPYAEALRRELLTLHEPGANELHHAALLTNLLSEEYAVAINELRAAQGNPRTVAVGCHGQTIRHRPDQGYTLQLVNGALIAERTGLTTVTDFRSRDLAAGGQGAPLVPAFHAAYLASANVSRAIVNIGGIANVTYLPLRGPVIGFDTGPGNMLMDAWAARHLGSPMDRDGAFGMTGNMNETLLASLMSDTYFVRSPPKSTGRDLFNIEWLESHIRSSLSPNDVQATLCEFTAASIVQAILRWCQDTQEIYVCGGGARNTYLMRRIAAQAPNLRVESTQGLGIDPDWMEAMAFAWLARRALLGMSGNLAEVTGARGARVLGAIYPA